MTEPWDKFEAIFCSSDGFRCRKSRRVRIRKPLLTRVSVIITMSGLDPSVIAMFGHPPPEIDLAENYRPRSTIVTALLLLCTILIVVLRFAAKKVHGASLYADDYAIVVALVCSILIYQMLKLVSHSCQGNVHWHGLHQPVMYSSQIPLHFDEDLPKVIRRGSGRRTSRLGCDYRHAQAGRKGSHFPIPTCLWSWILMNECPDFLHV